MWEHWDSIKEDGSFWSSDINSFNHYTYGAVADWVYEEAAGIHMEEPGFAKIRFAPKTDSRLVWLEASIDTVHGLVSSKWVYECQKIRYEFETPVTAQVEIDGVCRTVAPGKHQFYGNV